MCFHGTGMQTLASLCHTQENPGLNTTDSEEAPVQLAAASS